MTVATYDWYRLQAALASVLAEDGLWEEERKILHRALVICNDKTKGYK